MVILRGLPDTSLAGATLNARLTMLCQRENCIVVGRTRRAECPPAARPMMLVAAHGGRESYTLGRQRVAVDDDNFLLLNAGRSHASLIQSTTDVESFRIFFRAEMTAEVLAPLVTPEDRLLERETSRENSRDSMGFEFCEGLRPHDRLASPVLRYIRHHVLSGTEDAAWIDEQLAYLLERLLLGHREVLRRVRAMPCVRSATRREMYRRVTMAVDYIESCYEQCIELETLAQVACLSKFHFLRAFRALLGVTPRDYVQRKRAIVAKRMLETTELSVAEIAVRVGYASRTSLSKQVRYWIGAAPVDLRVGSLSRPAIEGSSS